MSNAFPIPSRAVPRVAAPVLQPPALFSWHARFASLNALTGEVGTFSRPSSALTNDTTGAVVPTVTERHRWQARDWTNSGSRGHLGLLLESDRTNICTRSQEFDQWTPQLGAAVTANAVTAPDGTLTGDFVNSASGTANATIYRAVTFTGNGEKCASIYIKQGTALVCEFGIFDATATVWRHRVVATWTAGVPVLSTNAGSGTRYSVESAGNGWYRVSLSALSVVAANANFINFYQSNSGGEIGGTYVWGAQVEDAAAPSSYISTTTTTAARSRDRLSWPLNWAPQPFTFVFEYIEGWKVLQQGALFSLSSPSGTTYSVLYYDTSGNLLFEMVNNNVGRGTGFSFPTSFGDRVIVRGQVYADGSVQLFISVNGGAEQATARTTANPSGLPAQWLSSTRTRLNHYNDDGLLSAAWYRRLSIYPGLLTLAEAQSRL